jgi:hypothetical protein
MCLRQAEFRHRRRTTTSERKSHRRRPGESSQRSNGAYEKQCRNVPEFRKGQYAALNADGERATTRQPQY